MKTMKHKHRWQFVKLYNHTIDRVPYPDYMNTIATKEVKINLEKAKAIFICECGKVKIVEVKR